MKPYLLFLVSICFFSCDTTSPEGSSGQIPNGGDTSNQAIPASMSEIPAYRFPYDLNKPDETFKLSNKLVEISGLSLSEDGQFLVAVNDEEGKVFFVNKSNGDIEEEIKFGKSGDYEGVEMVGDVLYAVRNNGTIVEVKNLGKDDQKDEIYNTWLDSDYDVEGLGYDSKYDRLLLACKGKAGVGEQFRQTKAVYGFNLNTKTLEEKPIWLIDRREIRAFAEKKGKKASKLIELLSEDSSPAAFAPSGIAIHPISKDVYLVSSVGKVLVIIKPNGKLVHLERLDDNIFRQPEGICFEADGTMYISSEGKGGKGRIFRFDPS